MSVSSTRHTLVSCDSESATCTPSITVSAINSVAVRMAKKAGWSIMGDTVQCPSCTSVSSPDSGRVVSLDARRIFGMMSLGNLEQLTA